MSTRDLKKSKLESIFKILESSTNFLESSTKVLLYLCISFSSVFSQSSVTLFLRCSHSIEPWVLQRKRHPPYSLVRWYKVQLANEPKGKYYQDLTWCQQHDATKRIEPPPPPHWTKCMPLQQHCPYSISSVLLVSMPTPHHNPACREALCVYVMSKIMEQYNGLAKAPS